jgi:sec-independent protein translocase protein TatA
VTPIVGLIEGQEWMIVAVVVLLLFGSSRLPGLARSLGEAQRELRKALAERDDDHARDGGHDGPPG